MESSLPFRPAILIGRGLSRILEPGMRFEPVRRQLLRSLSDLPVPRYMDKPAIFLPALRAAGTVFAYSESTETASPMCRPESEGHLAL